ncbi:MAG: SVM family protein [Candidatus Phytoplasma australasiaticum]|nr:SVM family protein [Candidatus Phytoplasma australasiaticum]MDV3199805.1 SVM family protein [Candidatus Phytoplasma australasiaticum]
MMQIKNKLHLLPLFLISYLGLFALININPVMAMKPKLPITSSKQPVNNNLTTSIEEKITTLKQEIYNNAIEITNISKSLQELVNINDDRQKILLKLKENYKKLIDNQKKQIKLFQKFLKDLNDDLNDENN